MSYWGPLFPDRAGNRFTAPAVAARLVLADPFTHSGALEYARIEARAEGAVGNDITVSFVADALTEDGELNEDVDAKTVLVKFISGATTVQQVANLLQSGSALVVLAGAWNPVDRLMESEDEFDFTGLSGGLDARSRRVTYWGPLFPDRRVGHGDPAHVDAVFPIGAAQFVLSLESGFSVSYEWITSLFKSYDGRERRESVLNRPRQEYRGSAHLVGDQGPRTRLAIAQFASRGSIFLLGLAHEGATVEGPAGATLTNWSVPLFDGSMLDWAVPGQRVAVFSLDDDAALSVVQSADASSVTVDQDPGEVAAEGSELIPLVPVILDPRQGFARRGVPRNEAQGDVTTWQIVARGAAFGFRSAPVPARLALAGLSVAFAGATVVARQPGTVGNGIEFQLISSPGPASLIEAVDFVAVTFESGVTTAEEVAAALAPSTIVALVGEWDDDAVLTVTDDPLDEPLNGGADEGYADVGVGAELTTYAGSPVWDRGIDRGETVGDSTQSMADVVDLGGAPEAIGGADQPDDGRYVAITRSGPEELQWLKLFLHTVKGRWRSWWLPTHGEDLVAVGDAPGGGGGSGELLVDSTIGDVAAWFALGRNHIQVEQGGDDGGDPRIYRLLVEGIQDNGDGTTTLEILADPLEPTATVPEAGPVASICWLDLCRFESDKLTISYRGATFEFTENARVVRQ